MKHNLLHLLDRPSFTPQRIAGIFCWYDASDVSTLTKDGFNKINQWHDKSGNKYHATQGIYSKQPTHSINQQNLLPCITFDGSNTLIMPSGTFSIVTNNNTIFAVSKRDTETSAIARIISMTNGATNFRYTLGYHSNPGTIQFASNSTGNVVNSTGANNTNYQIIMGRLSGSTQYISYNNTQELGGTGSTTTVTGAYIGSNTDTDRYLIGGIAEMIIYNRALTTQENISVYKYLSRKWGIALS